MDFTIFYAKLIGFYFVILAVCMLVNAKDMRLFIEEMIGNKTLVIFTGIMSILFGLVVVLTHNVWVGWPIIITLLGYISVLRGIARLCCTDRFALLASRLTQAKPYYIVSIILLVLGAVLLCCAYC